ncbi:hypothetical protein FI667_g9968, partial [Globisporangium splendens]
MSAAAAGAAAWDPQWNLRAPSSSNGANSYACWKRRVQAFLEAESVWEVVSESVAFDETWPLPKQLEFIQKDKLGVHLLFTTLHDSVLRRIDQRECNRSWLIVKRIDALFAEHRMKAVRCARREFLTLNFDAFVQQQRRIGSGSEEEDAMQLFICRVRDAADALFRLQGRHRGGPDDDDAMLDDEKMYQLLDALPESWAPFIAQECESRGDLTWQSLQTKVLREYGKRCEESLRSRLLQGSGNGGNSATSTSTAIVAVNTVASPAGNRVVSGAGTNSQQEALPSERHEANDDRGGSAAPAVFASPMRTAKTEPTAHFHAPPPSHQLHQENHYDLRSDEESMGSAVFDFVGQPPPPQHQHPSQHQQQQEPYQQHQPQQQQYHHPSQDQQQFDHARPKYNNNRNPNYPRHGNNRRDRDPRNQPYGRPPNSGQKTCFYCAEPGHTAHQCQLKRMHMGERKKNNLP